MLDEDLGIDKYHAAILRVAEGLKDFFEWIPVSKIYEKLRYNKSLINKKIRDLIEKRLLKISFIAAYNEHGIKITQKGIDYIALWDYKRNMILKKILTKIGEGKESIIYSGISYDDEFVVIKMNRYVKLKFRKVRKSPAFVSIEWWAKKNRIPFERLDIPKAKAQIEYYFLEKVYKKYPVPKPISINRHSVLMEMIYDEPGIPSKRLNEIKLENPEEFLEKILEIYDNLYKKEKIVHGDFSAENILVKRDGSFYIIDWCQAFPANLKISYEIYKRDKENIIDFFKRKYKLSFNNN